MSRRKLDPMILISSFTRYRALGAFSLATSAAVAAACGSDSSSGGGNPDGGSQIAPEPAPSITNVAVDGSAGAQVRQGYGGVPTYAKATIHITGKFLEGAINASVGSIAGEITDSSSTTVTFTVIVPHGAPLGLQPVVVSTPRGSQSFASGVTITPITSSPAGTDGIPDAGTDAGSAGTSDAAAGTPVGTDESPFRSLAKALSIASAGDTVFLRTGPYSQGTSGDAFASDPQHPNVAQGLTIKGESGTTLVGGGAANYGLVLAGDARIETLDISSFHDGVVAPSSGNVTLSYVTSHDNIYEGLTFGGTSNVTLESVVVSGNHGDGVSIVEGASVAFTSGHIYNSAGVGIKSTGSGTIAMTGTEVNNNSQDGIEFTGGPSNVSITSANIHDHANSGLLASQSSHTPVSITITGTKFIRVLSGSTDLGR